MAAFRSNAKEVAVSYLTALSVEDFKTARSYLNDNTWFQTPIASYNSADEYFKGNEMLRSKYGIEKVVYEIKKVFVDDDDVCVFFDFHVGSATLFTSGWFQVNDGKISSIRVVFDPRPIFELSVKK
ncbi:MAG: nuclear transport factor 2 family protein [Thermoproteota archaeon]